MWTHVVLTYNNSSSSNDPTLYINGSIVSISKSISPSGTATSDSSNDFYMGKANHSSPGYFDGGLDDVRLYKGTVLTSAQVATLYNSGNGTENSLSGVSVSAYYRLGASTTTYLNNTTRLSYGKFNGTDNYVSIHNQLYGGSAY